MRTALVIFFLILLGSCISQSNFFSKDWAYFEDWDKDENLILDRAEFIEGYARADFFQKWNNKNDFISYGDFFDKIFISFDLSKDSKLDSSELYSKKKYYYFKAMEGSLGQWDDDNNYFLDVHEFTKHAEAEGLSVTFDASLDGRISSSEMAEGMFNTCDQDNNGKVAIMEFYLWEVYRR